jgi:AcrR family transcriptional regulator
MASKASRHILETAIDLFAASGFNGVGIRALAEGADVTPSSIFRLFRSKEKLFECALSTVVSSSIDPDEFGRLLEVEEKDFAQVLEKAIRRWYSSVSSRSARLLAHAALSNNDQWRELGFARTNEISKLLASRIQKEARKTKRGNLDATASARTLIMALLNVKSSRTLMEPGEKERAVVDSIIHQWIQGLLPGR